MYAYCICDKVRLLSREDKVGGFKYVRKGKRTVKGSKHRQHSLRYLGTINEYICNINGVLWYTRCTLVTLLSTSITLAVHWVYLGNIVENIYNISGALGVPW